MLSNSFLPHYREALGLLNDSSFPDSNQLSIAAIRCKLFEDKHTIIGVNGYGHLFLWLDPLLQDMPLYSISIGKLSISRLDLCLLGLNSRMYSLPENLSGSFLRVDASDFLVRVSVIDLVVDYLLSDPRKAFQAWLADLASLFDSRAHSDVIGLAGELIFLLKSIELNPAYLDIWSIAQTSLFDFQPSSYSQQGLKHIEVKTTISPSQKVIIKALQYTRQRDFENSLLCNVILELSINGLNCNELTEMLLSSAALFLDELRPLSLSVRARARLAFLGDAYDEIRIDLQASKYSLYSFILLPCLPSSIDPAISIESYRLDLEGCIQYDSGLL